MLYQCFMWRVFYFGNELFKFQIWSQMVRFLLNISLGFTLYFIAIFSYVSYICILKLLLVLYLLVILCQPLHLCNLSIKQVVLSQSNLNKYQLSTIPHHIKIHKNIFCCMNSDSGSLCLILQFNSFCSSVCVWCPCKHGRRPCIFPGHLSFSLSLSLRSPLDFQSQWNNDAHWIVILSKVSLFNFIM